MHRGETGRRRERALTAALAAALAVLFAGCSTTPPLDLPDFALRDVAAEFDAVAQVRVEREGETRWNSESGERWVVAGNDVEGTAPVRLSVPHVVVERVLWTSADASTPLNAGDDLDVWFAGATGPGAEPGSALVTGESYLVMLRRAPVQMREGATDDVWWSLSTTGVWDETAEGFAPRSGAQRTDLYVLAESGMAQVTLDRDVPSLSPAALAALLGELDDDGSPAAQLLKTVDPSRDYRPSSREQDERSDEADARAAAMESFVLHTFENPGIGALTALTVESAGPLIANVRVDDPDALASAADLQAVVAQASIAPPAELILTDGARTLMTCTIDEAIICVN